MQTDLSTKNELHHSDRELTASQLYYKYNPDGDGEHPYFTREDWRSAVVEKETLLGYWDWVEHMIEGED